MLTNHLIVPRRTGHAAAPIAFELPTTQRIMQLRKFGGVEELAVVDASVPAPGQGEVLVKVLAASVQFTDVMLRKGRYSNLKADPPLVLGCDVVGEVVKVGAGVTAPLVGQRVADLTMTGSYAQYRLLDAARVSVVSPLLEPAEVATLVLSWMTAYQLLHRDARVRPGQSVLVVGASGAVGQALVALARLAGCQVWGAAHLAHAHTIRAHGATFVDDDAADFAKVRPHGFDVVFDGVGSEGFSRAWRAVGPRGHLSAFGFSAAIEANASLFQIGLSFAKLWWWDQPSRGRSASFYSISATRKQHADWFSADFAELLRMLDRGEIAPRVAERIGFDSIVDAHVRLERGGVEGKIVLVPNG